MENISLQVKYQNRFKKKFGKRQLFQTYKQRVQIDITVNFI